MNVTELLEQRVHELTAKLADTTGTRDNHKKFNPREIASISTQLIFNRRLLFRLKNYDPKLPRKRQMVHSIGVS